MEDFLNARIKQLKITHPFLQESQLLCRAKQEYLKSDEYNKSNNDSVPAKPALRKTRTNQNSTATKRKLSLRQKLNQLSDDFTVNKAGPKSYVSVPATNDQLFEHVAGLPCQENNPTSSKKPIDVYEFRCDDEDCDKPVPPRLYNKKLIAKKTVNSRRVTPKTSTVDIGARKRVSTIPKSAEKETVLVEIQQNRKITSAQNIVASKDHSTSENPRKKSKKEASVKNTTPRAAPMKKKVESKNSKLKLSLMKTQNERKKSAVCEVVAAKKTKESVKDAKCNTISTKTDEINKSAKVEKRTGRGVDVIAETQLMDVQLPDRDESDDSDLDCELMTRYSVSAMTSVRFKNDNVKRIISVEDVTNEPRTENDIELSEKHVEINEKNIETTEKNSDICKENIDIVQKSVQTVGENIQTVAVKAGDDECVKNIESFVDPKEVGNEIVCRTTVDKNIETTEKNIDNCKENIGSVEKSVQIVGENIQTVKAGDEECVKNDESVDDPRDVGNEIVSQTTADKLEVTNVICSLNVLCNGNEVSCPINSSAFLDKTNNTANDLASAVAKFIQTLQSSEGSKNTFGGKIYWKLEIGNFSSERRTNENVSQDSTVKNTSPRENDAQDVNKLLRDDKKMEKMFVMDNDVNVEDQPTLVQSQNNKPRLLPKKMSPKRVKQKKVYFPDIIEEEEYSSLEETEFLDDTGEIPDNQSTVILTDSDEGNAEEDKICNGNDEDDNVVMLDVEEVDWNDPFRLIDTRIGNLLNESKELENVRNTAWNDANRILKRIVRNMETKNSWEDESTDSVESTQSEESDASVENFDDESNDEEMNKTQMDVEECQERDTSNLDASLLNLFSDPTDDNRALYGFSPSHQMKNLSSDEDFFFN